MECSYVVFSRRIQYCYHEKTPVTVRVVTTLGRERAAAARGAVALRLLKHANGWAPSMRTVRNHALARTGAQITDKFVAFPHFLSLKFLGFRSLKRPLRRFCRKSCTPLWSAPPESSKYVWNSEAKMGLDIVFEQCSTLFISGVVRDLAAET